jgi:hypothetical protein
MDNNLAEICTFAAQRYSEEAKQKNKNKKIETVQNITAAVVKFTRSVSNLIILNFAFLLQICLLNREIVHQKWYFKTIN